MPPFSPEGNFDHVVDATAKGNTLPMFRSFRLAVTSDLFITNLLFFKVVSDLLNNKLYLSHTISKNTHVEKRN